MEGVRLGFRVQGLALNLKPYVNLTKLTKPRVAGSGVNEHQMPWSAFPA